MRSNRVLPGFNPDPIIVRAMWPPDESSWERRHAIPAVDGTVTFADVRYLPWW